ncbi:MULTISPECIES: helix-turn-helix domain-containing protein [Alloalcanivorax]|uniref:Helix-turn-helix domain-containing protein n=2 Tax=Alloalcanivorax TaxID=3020832 RepID=A0A9Q3W6C8_9GAMM|nr:MULTISPECIES: helix-turn-helix domain-containing protein [Alloalcanivorax]KYZ88179.1 transcriptional regulator [Alcanivorax sp. KX64203]MBA4720786.1 helix-turn-helix domain-containing protein [Alcanivorax sp.]ARB45549.1 DNA-binding protein [Alloalcanivorax xenomutans]MCE7509344.1 helix-turn-helix domain-containing protein [Alloalcanivorax xenomutans]MCE7524971.1 helix-turn-helix domain-containing protein [Alloalcanivorax xenomutans]|tara:strand:+ start:538 stop:843 length:306 start_codon:yes stop_codon:yes gene_type:complete
MLEITRILEQRRKSLGLTQKDMLMRIGMSQQQYQRIESGGDTRVSTLLRILEGMGLQLRLVPEEQVAEVDALLNGTGRLERNILSEPDESHWDKILKDLED